MRKASLGLLVAVAAGLVALVVVGLTQRSSLVYTLGVVPQGPVAKLAGGDRACQGPIDLPRGASVERIGIYPAAARGEQPPLRITVRPAAGGRDLAAGTLAPGYGDGSPPPLRRAAIGRLRSAPPVTVCVTNRGSTPVALWGTGGIATASSTLSIDDKPINLDIGVTFERAGRRSLIAWLPDVAERASVFHPAWMSPALWAMIGVLVVLGAPALLLVAVRQAARADP